MSNGSVVLSSNVHVFVQHVPARSGHFLFCSFGDVSKIMPKIHSVVRWLGNT